VGESMRAPPRKKGPPFASLRFDARERRIEELATETSTRYYLARKRIVERTNGAEPTTAEWKHASRKWSRPFRLMEERFVL